MTTATAAAPATFELDEALKARILALAGRRKTGPLEIVREALAQLEREEDEDEAFSKRMKTKPFIGKPWRWNGTIRKPACT